MLQSTIVEASATERRRILLLAEDAALRSLISTFLVTMGHACTAVSYARLDAVLEREPLDAVLLDADHSGAATEAAFFKIIARRPSLAARILVIRSGLAAPETIELIERRNLHQASQENLVQQLWPALQGLFASPHAANLVPAPMQTAQVTFDSLRAPLPISLRGARSGRRQLLYQHRSATIDLVIEPRADSGRIAITGQILRSPKTKGESDGLPVLLVSEMRTVVRTITNQFGEFRLECVPVKEAFVEMRLREGAWVSLLLGELDWPDRRISD